MAAMEQRFVARWATSTGAQVGQCCFTHSHASHASGAGDLHVPELADVAIADQLTTEQHRRIVALLGAVLEHDVVPAHRIHHRLPLGNPPRQRFLAVDMLPGPGRRDGNQGVPMVGRRHVNGVNIRTRQHLAEIVIGPAILFDRNWLLGCAFYGPSTAPTLLRMVTFVQPVAGPIVRTGP